MQKHEKVIAALLRVYDFLILSVDFLRVPALVYTNDLYPPQQTIYFNILDLIFINAKQKIM